MANGWSNIMGFFKVFGIPFLAMSWIIFVGLMESCSWPYLSEFVVFSIIFVLFTAFLALFIKR